MSKCKHGTDLTILERREGNTFITEIPYCQKCLGIPEKFTGYKVVPVNADGTFGPIVIRADDL